MPLIEWETVLYTGMHMYIYRFGYTSCTYTSVLATRTVSGNRNFIDAT